LSPSLFTLGRFRAASSGLRFRLSAEDLNPLPLLSASCSSPRSFTSTFQPHLPALASAPLLGFRPLQRSTESGVRIPGGSNRRHRSSSGFLTLSTICSARNHAGLISSPLRSWGFPAPFTSNGPFDPTGVLRSRFPLHGFLLPRDGHVLACPPVWRFAVLIRRYPFGARRERLRALHGLHRRRIGVSQGSEPRAPTVLRFSANYTLVNSERLLGPWVSPPPSDSVAATIQPLWNLPRPHLLQLHEPAFLPRPDNQPRCTAG